MHLSELLDCCKAEAIRNTVEPTEDSVWREICREYSKKFSTPLHLCLDGTIPAEDIVLANFEEQLSTFSADDHLDKILEEIYTLADPSYEKGQKKEVDDFMEKAERDEEERLKLGKLIHKGMKEKSPLETDIAPQMVVKKKTSGSINLSYLAREEERNGGNFES